MEEYELILMLNKWKALKIEVTAMEEYELILMLTITA